MNMIVMALVIMVVTYLVTFKADFDKEKLSKALLFMAVIAIVSFLWALVIG